MSQFGKTDQANNSPIWATALVNKTPNTVNQGNLFSNNSANAFITGATKGVFGVSTVESTASLGAVAHSGWVFRTVGTGGRAGRVHHETLIAGGFITGDVGNLAYPDCSVVFDLHPGNKSANNNSNTNFYVQAHTAPLGVTIAYVWQAANTSNTTFANLTNAGVYSNVTTATLSISNVAGLNNYTYRCQLDVTGETAAFYCANAILTVV